jgi:hypothetical protein
MVKRRPCHRDLRIGGHLPNEPFDCTQGAAKFGANFNRLLP